MDGNEGLGRGWLIALVVVLALLALTSCGGQTNVNTWTQTASASCSGFLCRAEVHQSMSQPDADKTLFAASLLAVASVLLAALALGGAL